jgi:hypothetical protein
MNAHNDGTNPLSPATPLLEVDYFCAGAEHLSFQLGAWVDLLCYQLLTFPGAKEARVEVMKYFLTRNQDRLNHSLEAIDLWLNDRRRFYETSKSQNQEPSPPLEDK